MYDIKKHKIIHKAIRTGSFRFNHKNKDEL